MMHTLRIVIGSCLLIGLAAFVPGGQCASAAVPVLGSGGRTVDSLPGVERAGEMLVSLTHLCELLGGRWEWDLFSERLDCHFEAGSLSFTLKNRFARRKGTVVQMGSAPQRIDAFIYLAAPGAVEAFSPLIAGRLGWDDDTRAIVRPGAQRSSPVSGKSSPASQLVAQPQAERIQTVVIDAGHGGRDPGAIGPGGTMEKDVVLPIALALRDALKKKSDLTVHMTREEDVFVELRDRTNIANRKNADLFVSIHANSIGGGKRKREQVKGYKVYFLSNAKNEEDKRVAMLENSVVELERKTEKKDFLQNVLLDMAANEYLLESQDMSIMIAESFGATLRKIRKIHTGVGQGPFWVLFGASMPSVLIETGFISNSREEKLLADPLFQKEMANAICEAILTFKDKYEAGL
jgi:N-acetylmuramoyl-L-alanine amidase